VVKTLIVWMLGVCSGKKAACFSHRNLLGPRRGVRFVLLSQQKRWVWLSQYRAGGVVRHATFMLAAPFLIQYADAITPTLVQGEWGNRARSCMKSWCAGLAVEGHVILAATGVVARNFRACWSGDIHFIAWT